MMGDKERGTQWVVPTRVDVARLIPVGGLGFLLVVGMPCCCSWATYFYRYFWGRGGWVVYRLGDFFLYLFLGISLPIFDVSDIFQSCWFLER